MKQNKAKRVIDALLGENELSHGLIGGDPLGENIREATQKLADILNEYSTADIEDNSPDPEWNEETEEMMGPGDEGYPEGWDQSEKYDTTDESDDLASFRSAIFEWLDDTFGALGALSPEAKAKAEQSLNGINMSVRHHMRHQTRDCLYNIYEHWNDFTKIGRAHI